jgi:hypothetical protein
MWMIFARWLATFFLRRVCLVAFRRVIRTRPPVNYHATKRAGFAAAAGLYAKSPHIRLRPD